MLVDLGTLGELRRKGTLAASCAEKRQRPVWFSFTALGSGFRAGDLEFRVFGGFSYRWLVGNEGMGYNYNYYYYHSSIPY